MMLEGRIREGGVEVNKEHATWVGIELNVPSSIEYIFEFLCRRGQFSVTEMEIPGKRDWRDREPSCDFPTTAVKLSFCLT